MKRAATTLAFWITLWVGLAIVCPAPQAAQTGGFRIIVHPSNPVSSVDRRFLADAFMKKVTRWPRNDELIRPVDLEPDAPARARFTETVFNRSVAALKNYWQQQVFAGREVPPPELEGDSEVVKYVSKHPGAIGYVSPGAALDNVRAIEVH
jgi:ABC-type phosphate transport system substrate-binding protein